ncbi:AHH domain-containing protein [Archangium sp.]|uniref:AHH domain-containing protein n=1 Tax=Archangium sp. TaxID=1872627 RepID=UPI002D35CDBB|nr:AHH domain-containing protein [Archangium sp.]HYO56130.1 AHH domain-containing protein [Archangium sp.]
MALTQQQMHILKDKKPVAVLDRGKGEKGKRYRDEGRDEISSDRGKLSSVYNNDAKIKRGLEAGNVMPRNGASYKQFDKGHLEAYYFDKFTGFRVPYPNAAHHLLPCETFKPYNEKSNPAGAFTEDQLEILRRVNYNVNNGKNIIFLPGFSSGVVVRWAAFQERKNNKAFGWEKLTEAERSEKTKKWVAVALEKVRRFWCVHMLPCHVDFHDDYTLKVRDDMKGIRNELKSQLENLCEDWQPPASIPTSLMELQDDYWGYVVRFGESRVLGQPSHLNELEKISDKLTQQGNSLKKGLGTKKD